MAGKKLFASEKLSKDGKVSCATCHVPNNFYQDGFEVSLSRGRSLTRNTPSLLNLSFYDYYFWDGRAKNLYEQVKQPLFGKNEIAANSTSIKNAIKQDVFLDSVSNLFISDTCDYDKFVIYSIVSYISTISTKETKFSLCLKGFLNFTNDEMRGYELFFGKPGCGKCHLGKYFTDNSFRYNGLAKRKIIPETYIDEKETRFTLGYDYGRGNVEQGKENMHLFRTPSLINSDLTYPYMHDGRYSNLESVIDFYDRGTDTSSLYSNDLGLTKNEKKQLIAFIKTLSDLRYSGESNMKKIRAFVKTNGLIYQEQDYLIEKRASETRITEIGRFIAEPKAEPLCIIVYDSLGYKEVKISFRSEKLNIKIEIERVDSKKFKVSFNDQKKTELSFGESEQVLFDGPNPIFDYINVVEILKMQNNHIKKEIVKTIDWSSGVLESISYTFKTEQKKVTVDKGDENFDSVFYLHDSMLISNYCTKHEVYDFEVFE